MNGYRTPEEVRNFYQEKMGDELGRVFHLLWEEVSGVHLKWSEFQELYTTKESRIELLNSTAPLFFYLHKQILLNDIVLHISKLTDPTHTGEHRNLTIKALPGLIDDEHLAQRIDTLVRKASDAAAPCRDLRNRYIAHMDWPLHLEEEPVRPLPEVDRMVIQSALDAIADVMREINMHFTGTDLIFQVFAPGKASYPGGAVALLYVLDSGLRAQKEEQQRALRGDIQNLRPREI